MDGRKVVAHIDGGDEQILAWPSEVLERVVGRLQSHTMSEIGPVGRYSERHGEEVFQSP